MPALLRTQGRSTPPPRNRRNVARKTAPRLPSSSPDASDSSRSQASAAPSATTAGLAAAGTKPAGDPLGLFIAAHGADGYLSSRVSAYPWVRIGDDVGSESATDMWPHGPPTMVRGVWRRRAPSAHELFDACVDVLDMGQTYCPYELAPGKPGRAIRQLNEPDCHAPCFIRNLEPRLETAELALPSQLAKSVILDYTSPMRVDVTPKHALLDLRVAGGAHVIAASVAAEHIWFLFPPAAHNMKVLHDHDCMHVYNRLARALPELEGGVIAVTSGSDGDGANADLNHTEDRAAGSSAATATTSRSSPGVNVGIFLPAGTIYASYVTGGGFLCRAGFASRDAIRTATVCAAHALDAAAAAGAAAMAASATSGAARQVTAAAATSSKPEPESASAAGGEEAAQNEDSLVDERRVAAAASAEASAVVLIYRACLAGALLGTRNGVGDDSGSNGSSEECHNGNGHGLGSALLAPAASAALAAWVEWQRSLLASEELLDAVAPIWTEFLDDCRRGIGGSSGSGDSAKVGTGGSGSGDAGGAMRRLHSPGFGHVTAHTLRCPCSQQEHDEDFVRHWVRCHLGALSSSVLF